LANFVKSNNKNIVLDIGSGSGIIPILLAGKLGFQNIYGVEINKNIAELSCRSIVLNNLQDKIQIINAPIQNIKHYLCNGICKVVTCNPPYNQVGRGDTSQNLNISKARFEDTLSLQEVLKAANYLLSTGGKFYMIHQVYRMAEIMHECIQNKLQPKIIKLIDKKRFLIQCTKDGKVGLLII